MSTEADCVFRERAVEDAERMRACLAEVSIDPDRVHIDDHGHASVTLNGLSDAEQRLVHRAWRLIDPVNVPEHYEDW